MMSFGSGASRSHVFVASQGLPEELRDLAQRHPTRLLGRQLAGSPVVLDREKADPVAVCECPCEADGRRLESAFVKHPRM